MQIKENVSLLPYNTFDIDVHAQFFAEVSDKSQILEISHATEKRILGGGSNVLLTNPVEGLVLLNCLKGKKILQEDEQKITLEVSSGEVWHELVLHAINNNWAGIENLALIPGTVGAAPMQNIGAYGVEAKETIISVTGWLWQEKCFETYTNEACKFGYRDSIFKQELKNKIFITSVVFELNKQPSFKTSYGAITEELEKMKVVDLSVKAIADAVINIRSSKLPDPKKIGNAGSFFKNPVISHEHFVQIKKVYTDMPSYPSHDKIKIPAGWLIEYCGWKGYRKDDAGVHAKQALVLVNYAHASGKEILELSEEIIISVKSKFDITLEREVQIW